MNEQQIFLTWTARESPWSLFVKPVLFAQMRRKLAQGPVVLLELTFDPGPVANTAFIVDLEREHAVRFGLTLAERHGVRPVPLYNASTADREVIPQDMIVSALDAGAVQLEAMKLSAAAPPAFLLDAARNPPDARVSPGMFDNRWRVFEDDFPSPRFMVEHDLTRVLYVHRAGTVPGDDLAPVLAAYGHAGLEILEVLADRQAAPEPYAYQLPRSLSAAVSSMISERPKNGFGKWLPEVSSSGG